MQLNLIEIDIKDREEILARCRSNLYALHTLPGNKNEGEIRLLGQQIFYLKDQLEKFYILVGILKEEQGSHDEMLPKA